MRFSEAIRLGAMMKPQGRGGGDNRDVGETSCALQAAAEASGLEPWDMYYGLLKRYPIMRTPAWPTRCAVCAFMGCAPYEIVYHLNDEHRWTREAIADWVESIERQHETPSRETPADPAVVPVLAE